MHGYLVESTTRQTDAIAPRELWTSPTYFIGCLLGARCSPLLCRTALNDWKKERKKKGNKNQQRGEKEIPTAHFPGGYRCPPLPVLDCWKIWGWAMHETCFLEDTTLQKNEIWKVNDPSSTMYSFALSFVLFLCESHIGKQKCKHRINLNDMAGGWPSHLMPPHWK